MSAYRVETALRRAMYALLCAAAGTCAAQDATEDAADNAAHDAASNAASDAASNGAADYAATMADADGLSRHNAHIQRLLGSQETEIASLEAQIDGLDATAAALQPLLDRMYESLRRLVAADPPFLVEERSRRLARLREIMASDGDLSEPFRRLMEAYQIELEYGRTMAAYRATLDGGREATFVRLGRVALMYRTADGAETGYFDAGRRTWVADRNHRRAIEEALGMAEEEIAPDLVVLPVPAAEETRW